MNSADGTEQSASGERSVAAHTISGTVTTGDNTRIVTLEAGTIPAPGQVALAARVDNLPRPPAPVFSGRDTALGLLAGALAADASVVVTQAVYGLGGVGKSELVLHHAHAHRSNYQLVWWITAAGPEQVEAGLAALAGRLCPPVALAGSTQDAAAWALGWLQCHDRWLLILDNVDDPADITGLLGQLRGGHIVLTTRRDVNWQTIATPIRLDILDPGPAAQIIIDRTGHATGQDQADAAAVAAELGFLPLALDQATAYMIQARIRPGHYLGTLRRHPTRLYATAAGQAEQTIARLWDITIDAIRGRDPGAVRLLQILACYAPDNIPRVLLTGHDDSGEIDEQLGLLASCSMITLTADSISMHRLVQAVTLAMSPPLDARPVDIALEWLNNAIPPDPDGNVTAWPLLRALIPHADALTSHYPDGQQPHRLGRVHNQFAIFYQSQGDYQQALKLRESALRIYQAHLEPDHPHLGTALGNLARTYSALGRAADALPLEQRALQITETALEPGHPDVAIRLGNLARTYSALGRAADALPLEQRALQITETALEPGHPDVAIRLGNLARTYSALGRAADALPLEQRALQITETALEPGHPDVATVPGNLARTYGELGRPADALPLEQRALQITETALGPGHPDMATALGNLALTYGELGRAADALPLEQRALQITETALGPGHPDMATALGNLGGTYSGLGRAADALPLEQRALQITETALGPGHPDMATALGNLGGTYSGLGRAADALPLEQRALQIRARQEGSGG